jgi:hypothetical protein
MLTALRRYWFLLPALASLATQCDEMPRGVAPSPIVDAALVLRSVPADPPADLNIGFLNCLDELEGLASHVRPSWRGNVVVLLQETGPNVFSADFNDVPASVQNTMTVHDQNECARNIFSQGHVRMGVFVNGVEVTNVIGPGVLTFVIKADGTVIQ